MAADRPRPGRAGRPRGPQRPATPVRSVLPRFVQVPAVPGQHGHPGAFGGEAVGGRPPHAGECLRPPPRWRQPVLGPRFTPRLVRSGRRMRRGCGRVVGCGGVDDGGARPDRRHRPERAGPAPHCAPLRVRRRWLGGRTGARAGGPGRDRVPGVVHWRCVSPHTTSCRARASRSGSAPEKLPSCRPRANCRMSGANMESKADSSCSGACRRPAGPRGRGPACCRRPHRRRPAPGETRSRP